FISSKDSFVEYSAARTKLATVALVTVGFALGFAEFIVIGITPDIAEIYQIPLSDAGNLVGYFAVAYAVSTPIIVLSTGRFRRFPLFVIFLIVFNVGNILAILAPSYEVLMLARICTAIVSGVTLSTVMTFINDIIPQEQAPRIISFVYAGFSVASVLGTPIGTLLSDAFGIKSAFVAVEAVALLVTVLLLISVPRSGSTDVSSSVREQLVILKDRRIILVLVMKAFGMAATYVFYVYVTPILEDSVGLSVWMVSLVLFFYGGATIVSNLSSGSLAQRYGLGKLPLMFALQAVVLALLGISLASGNTVLCIINVVLTGVFIYHMNAPLQSYLLQVSAKDYPRALTLASAVMPTSSDIGIATGSFMGGVVATNLGFAWSGPVGAVLAVVSVVAAFMILQPESRMGGSLRSRLRRNRKQ
ncbi:MAG: MFS transporter, partial [Eggerthellaceae bacterium]|nr:MFS transporter [Eggerthellaceae bacterium]